MKSLKTLFLLATFTLALATGIIMAFGTDAVSTVLSVGAVQTVFYALTYYGIVPMPSGILGDYVGAPGVQTESGSAGVQVINSERSRGVFMAYRTKPEYAGKNMTQSYLRLEAVIKNNGSIIAFKTFVGDGTSVASTERRLDRNDKFVISEIGMAILAQEIGKTNGRLCFYPNPTEFGAAAADLEALYAGELSIVINGKKYLVALDTQRFLAVPETMQSAAGNRDQYMLLKQLVHLTPHIELDGSGTNEIEVKFPIYAGWAGGTAAAGKEHRLVLYFHGLLITGGSANI